MEKTEILNYFKISNHTRYDGNKTKWNYLIKNDLFMYNLLKNWYSNINEETTIRDILYSIEHDYDKIPECVVCHKPLHIGRTGHNPEYHFPLFCSRKCRRSEEGKKIEQEHYKLACERLYGQGITNSLLSPAILEKRKATCKLKYGTEYPLLNKDILLKTFNSNGMALSYKDNDDTYIFKHNDLYMQLVYLKKKLNNTLNTSKIENLLYEHLKCMYKTIHHYKSKEYPFVCDFYLPDYNVYIELLANWMHGGHPFNENDENDIITLNTWRIKSEEINFKGLKKYGYAVAIDTWVKRDVNKRNIAKLNNLNYLELFSNDLSYCILQINNYINKNYNII